MKIKAELLHYGPVRTEARRIAKETIRQELTRRSIPHEAMSDKQWENLVTVALWNSGNQFLTMAKFNLENRK
jgi:hypothetical protein